MVQLPLNDWIHKLGPRLQHMNLSGVVLHIQTITIVISLNIIQFMGGKKPTISSITREVQSKTTMRYHYTFIRIATI
jgi:hypothetical protein